MTFAVLDELGFWLPPNHGHALADAILRNLAGMSGRFLGTTNAWALDEASVAQRLADAAGDGVYVDDVEPGAGSVRDKRERRRMLRKVYGDAAAGCEAQGNGAGRMSRGSTSTGSRPKSSPCSTGTSPRRTGSS